MVVFKNKNVLVLKSKKIVLFIVWNKVIVFECNYKVVIVWDIYW